MLDELKRRFESEVEKIGVTRIANALGKSRGTIYNWIANCNVPLDKFAMLQQHGIDAGYILTGQHANNAPSILDMHRFQLAIEAVEEGLDATNRTMAPAKKAELFLAVYEMMEEPTVTKARVLQLVKLAA